MRKREEFDLIGLEPSLFWGELICALFVGFVFGCVDIDVEVFM